MTASPSREAAPVAIVDIGSNSIKVLVAAAGVGGAIAVRHARTIDARISAGISREHPRLTTDGMAAGLGAIQALIADVRPHAPRQTVLVATSAVRQAENGADFAARVAATTGHTLRILSGDEEANLIGRGLTTDPALLHLRDFYVFDLGGGSLECLAFRDRKIVQAGSFPLGCVRLTEKFQKDPTAPLSEETSAQIMHEVHAALAAAGFGFPLAPGAIAVATGGTISTVRSILGARFDRSMEETEPSVTVAQIRELLGNLGALPLAVRRTVPGLPPARADVLPAGLATFLAVAAAGGFAAFQHSLHNLRFGLAAELLDIS